MVVFTCISETLPYQVYTKAPFSEMQEGKRNTFNDVEFSVCCQDEFKMRILMF